MIDRIFGIKLGMTQIFKEGRAIPITVVKTGPCKVIEKKVAGTHGYNAVKVGFVETAEKKVNKPEMGYYKKQNTSPFKYLKEIRVDKAEGIEIGNSIGANIFEIGEYVDVAGISKGKGFQGIMKRHGASGGAGSHGSMFHRAPGSIGASSDPSRVFKGTIMPGRMGGNKVTVKNLEVVSVDNDKNIVLLKGAVPGCNKGLVEITKTGEKKRIVVPQVKPGAVKKEKASKKPEGKK